MSEEKAQVRTWSKKLNKKYGKVAQIEMILRDPFIPEKLEESLRASLPKQKVIIANALSRKHGVRVSTIKTFLRDMESDGRIQLVSTSSRIRIYTGTDAKK